MWQVDNQTPFAAQGYFVRDTNGFEHWVVALRASFLIRADGLLDIDQRQAPVNVASFYADEKSEELAIDSDIAPFRPKVDLT